MRTSDYNSGERLLHRLALGVPAIRKASFELDRLFVNNKGQDYSAAKHVFVSGLARAGTTILMRALYSTGQFRSLTYRDMPFVLMPGLWSKISRSFHKYEEAKERAHGDRIYVDFDSPEAFEEVFWLTFSGDEYILDNCLQPHTVGKELIEQFRLYVRIILKSSSNHKQQRYLSKNNNNILRLGTIRKAFPNSLIIIPFREPVQQAISLLNQHRKFYDIHSTDKFAYDYMRWLGHYEFGMAHKLLCFEKKPDLSFASYDRKNINYWLNIWINTYRYLLKNASDGIFVCCEDLCDSPTDTLRYLFKSADLLLNGEDKVFSKPPEEVSDGLNETLLVRAQQIYQDLRVVTSSFIGNLDVQNKVAR